MSLRRRNRKPLTAFDGRGMIASESRLSGATS